MSCFGDYEVIAEPFSLSGAHVPLTVSAPVGKVVLGGGIEFASLSHKRGMTYTGWPAGDGSSWTFFLTYNTAQGTSGPYVGTAYITVASMGG